MSFMRDIGCLSVVSSFGMRAIVTSLDGLDMMRRMREKSIIR